MLGIYSLRLRRILLTINTRYSETRVVFNSSCSRLVMSTSNNRTAESCNKNHRGEGTLILRAFATFIYSVVVPSVYPRSIREKVWCFCSLKRFLASFNIWIFSRQGQGLGGFETPHVCSYLKCWLHARPAMRHFVHGRRLAGVPGGVAGNTRLSRLSWAILVTWSNHRSWNICIQRWNVSTFGALRIHRRDFSRIALRRVFVKIPSLPVVQYL